MAIRLERKCCGEMIFRCGVFWLARLAVLSGSTGALADSPPPAAKAAFLALPKIYIRWELTETGTHPFSAGPNDIR